MKRHLFKLHRIGIIILAVIYLRSAHFRFKSLEDILRMVRIGLFTQLVINRVSGRKNKEVLISLRFIQIIDAGTH